MELAKERGEQTKEMANSQKVNDLSIEKEDKERMALLKLTRALMKELDKIIANEEDYDIPEGFAPLFI